MYVCKYVCMYVCTYVRTYVRTYVCMYVCMTQLVVWKPNGNKGNKEPYPERNT